MAGWIHGPAPGPDTQPPRPRLPVSRQFTAADDKGTSYTLRFSTRITGSAAVAGVLDLRPDPQHEIGWLDLRTAPGEPATRIHLDPQVPAPDITVTNTAASPGELPVDVVAARVLAAASTLPQETPEQVAAAKPGLLPHVAGGLGDVITAPPAAGALPPSSPAPGQLAGLCARLGITGHGITTPPAADLPERWLCMLTRYHRRNPQRRPRPAAGPPRRPGCPSWTAPGSPSSACTTASAAPSCTCTQAASRWKTTGSNTAASGPCPPCGSATAPAAGTPRGTTPPGRWATTARSPWTWRSPRRSRQAPRGSTWWPPGHRPRSGPGYRSAGSGTHNSDPQAA